MSYNLNPLHCVQLRTPETDIHSNAMRSYGILRGGAQCSYKPYTTNSISTSSIQFTTPPPSPHILVDKKQYIQLPMRLVFNSAAPNANNLHRPGFSAPRSFVFSNIVNTLQVNINNTGISMNMSDVIQPLLRYNVNEVLQGHDWSLTPSYLDQSQEYSQLQGSVRSPLAYYGDSTEAFSPRGGFPYTIVSNTPSQLVIDIVITEPIFLSPFYFGCGNHAAFCGIQTMDWNLSFVSNVPNKAWCFDQSGVNAPGLITSTAWAFNNFSAIYAAPFSYGLSVPQLLFRYTTPNELQAIPKSLTYPYYVVDRYPYDFGATIAAGATSTLVSNNIQLKSIPERIYVCARNNNTTMMADPYHTDSFMAINGIKINWNNYSGLLSNATQADLYRMSQKNGCAMSWQQWSGQSMYISGSSTDKLAGPGSVLCVCMGDDIGLSDTEAPGLLGTYQLQMEVAVTNCNTINTVTPTLYIITISAGTFTIENNRSISQIGVISKMDILNAKQNESPYVDYDQVHDTYTGGAHGNFLSGIKQFGSEMWKYIKPGLAKAYRLGKKIAPYAQAAYGVAKSVAPVIGPLLLGLGKKGQAGRKHNKRGGAYVGGSLAEGNETVTGGREIPHQTLKDRLQRPDNYCRQDRYNEQDEEF